jgi:diaminohydroxyphosphoribosylaminopyrimidine deaminase/5-amino-6-(5-phosphoribosylamino)uracil reductase
VLADLAGRGVGSLLVEGGGEVAAAWVAAGLYDQVHAAVAPLLVAGRRAPGPLGGEGPASLAEAPRLDSLQMRRRGHDVILSALRQTCLPELSSSVGAS